MFFFFNLSVYVYRIILVAVNYEKKKHRRSAITLEQQQDTRQCLALLVRSRVSTVVILLLEIRCMYTKLILIPKTEIACVRWFIWKVIDYFHLVFKNWLFSKFYSFYARDSFFFVSVSCTKHELWQAARVWLLKYRKVKFELNCGRLASVLISQLKYDPSHDNLELHISSRIFSILIDFCCEIRNRTHK